MSAGDRVFEPLIGKGRTLRQALSLLVERWREAPLGDEDLGALEEALMHLFRRAQIRRQLPASEAPARLAGDFVRALREGRGEQALAAVAPATSPPPTGRAGRPTGT